MGADLGDEKATAFSLTEEFPRNDAMLLRLAGDVDLHTAPQLRHRLASVVEGDVTLVIVDLSEVTFVDSMTLGVLLGASKRLRAKEGELRLVVSEPNIRRIFEITLLDRVFDLHESTEAALERAVNDGAPDHG